MSIGPKLVPVPPASGGSSGDRSARPAEPAPEFGAVLGAALGAAQPPARARAVPASIQPGVPTAEAPAGSDAAAGDPPDAAEARADQPEAGPSSVDGEGGPRSGGAAGLGPGLKPRTSGGSGPHTPMAHAIGTDGGSAPEGEGIGNRSDQKGTMPPVHGGVRDAEHGEAAEERADRLERHAEAARPGDGVGAAGTDPVEPAPRPDAAARASISELAPAAALTRADSDPTLLDGEFRTRLDRVAERMREEYGHDVRIVEGYRSPERQAHLYAQGRTRPGPVVTWTRSSAHSRGLAADVLVDGSYDNPIGYGRLAKVAAEEGLRTLGAKDPGHIQMPDPAPRDAAESGAPADRIGQTRRGLAALEHGPGPAPARVARPAAVAAVAAVRAARVVESAATAEPARPAVPGPAFAAVPGPAKRAEHPSTTGDQPVRARPSEAARMTSPAASDAGTAANAGGEAATAAPATPVATQGARGGTAGLSGLPSADVAGRVMDAVGLQDRAAARPASHMLLHLDDVSGGEARIRVGVRGGTVDATLDIGDRATADRLSLRLAELRSALERKGLEPGVLRVRPIAVGAEPNELVRALAPGMATEGTRPASGTSRDAGEGPHQETPRDGTPHREKRDSEPDHPRSRRGANPEERA